MRLKALALKGFEHKAGHFEFIWDLQYAMQALPLLEYVKDQTQLKLLQIHIENYHQNQSSMDLHINFF